MVLQELRRKNMNCKVILSFQEKLILIVYKWGVYHAFSFIEKQHKFKVGFIAVKQ